MTLVIPPPAPLRQVQPLGRAERRVAAMIFRHPGITQQEIHRQMDFTQQYVSRLTGNLLEEKLVFRGERVRKGVGQPGIQLHINPDYSYALGLSIMTDALSMVLIDMTGMVRNHCQHPTDDMDPSRLAQLISENLPVLCSQADIDPGRVAGVGIGLTGYFVGDGARINTPDALAGLALEEIGTYLSALLQLPVAVDNDGNTAAVAEAMMGVGRWADTFTYLYIAAGFGGGVVVEGKLYRGAHGNAGEVANTLPLGTPYPTLSSLRQLYAADGREFPSLEAMLDHVALEDSAVQRWLDDAQEPLSHIVSAAAAVLDPEAIVFGGRLPPALGQALIERAEIYNADRRQRPKPTPRLVTAETCGDATAIGAALIPLMAQFY